MAMRQTVMVAHLPVALKDRALALRSLARRRSAVGMASLEAFEECEDGNTVAGDGCSNRCVLEGSSINYPVASILRGWRRWCRRAGDV